MSANVFLVPIDPENFDRTVQSAVDLTEYDDRPDPLADLDEVRLWAVDDDSGNGSTFERMEEGDLLLFYHDGEYLATGRVGTAFEDEDRWVSSTFWTAFPTTRVYTINHRLHGRFRPEARGQHHLRLLRVVHSRVHARRRQSGERRTLLDRIRDRALHEAQRLSAPPPLFRVPSVLPLDRVDQHLVGGAVALRDALRVAAFVAG